MAHAPDVHIVVPTMGQRQDLLRICLDSLTAQTHACRLTVIAGGNFDAVQILCREAGVTHVEEQRGKGLSAAINQAWVSDAWKSEFTGWLGDDDALPPWSVERAVERLRVWPRATMVHGRCLFVDGDGHPLWAARNGFLAARLVGYGINLIAQPGCLFRTFHVREVGGLDEGLRLAMDVDLYVRLRQRGSIVTSRAQLGVFRQHGSGLSTENARTAAQESRNVQRRRQNTRLKRTVEMAAHPFTRVVGRVTRRLPPAPSAYWYPH